MNLAEAKIEATARWRVWGGWAKSEDRFVDLPGVGVKKVTMCIVGVRRPDPPRGVEAVKLAEAQTFEEAFEAAEIRIQRSAQIKPRKPKPHPRALPNMEMDLG